MFSLTEDGIPRLSDDTGDPALTRTESFTNVVPQSFVVTVLTTWTVQLLVVQGEAAAAGTGI